MHNTENPKRPYYRREGKIRILNELSSGGMTISILARKHGIHPVTVHRWKREMNLSKKPNENDPNINEVLKEMEEVKQENENLKKALGDLSVQNQVFKTANEILKKKYRQKQLNSLKKSSRK